MLILHKVRYKNFLSAGNLFIEIDLSSHRKTLIVGENGRGKCLDPSTKVDIKFKSASTENKFKKFLENK